MSPSDVGRGRKGRLKDTHQEEVLLEGGHGVQEGMRQVKVHIGGEHNRRGATIDNQAAVQVEAAHVRRGVLAADGEAEHRGEVIAVEGVVGPVGPHVGHVAGDQPSVHPAQHQRRLMCHKEEGVWGWVSNVRRLLLNM